MGLVFPDVREEDVFVAHNHTLLATADIALNAQMVSAVPPIVIRWRFAKPPSH